MKKLIVVSLFVILLSSLLGSCGTPAQPAAETGVTQEAVTAPQEAASTAPIIVMPYDTSQIVTFDLQLACEQLPSMLFSLNYETLVRIDPTDFSNVLPYLAKSWEISEDHRTYTFHLFENAKFASGSQVTAEDVKFTLDRDRKDPATCMGAYLAPVESITAVDPLTVQITTTNADAAFLILLSTSGFGIMEKAVIEEHGGSVDAAATDTAKDWLDQNSAGSGPYVMTKWEPNAEVDYVANANWWQGTPNLSQFIVKHIQDPTLALQMLQTGEADLLPGLDLDLVQTVKNDANLSITSAQDIVTTYLAMNMDPTVSEITSNKLVRQAIVAAINKDEIIQTVLQGYATRAPSILSVGMLGVNSQDAAPYDPEAAKQLLSDAGYADGFTIQLSYPSTPPEWELVTTAIQSQLAEVGITVELLPTESSVYMTAARTGELPLFVGSWGPDTPDPTQLTDIFCYKDAPVGKRMRADMPEARPLCDQLHTEFDTAARAGLVQQITTIFNDYMPFTMMYQKQLVIAHTNAVTNVIYLPGRFIDLSVIDKQ